ncbi:MAG: CDP-diacylglycerol--serine O-phosphatidyltransferase [Planctomycetota bacterium]|nr:MAG: CDP-diacylglycerol--serine O-phosphatidyltransferase [Planctomycetota bacterium]
MRRLRAVAVFPTVFTLGNLVCGFFAIVVASRIARPDDVPFVPSPKLDSARELLGSLDPTHNLMLCGALIFLAMTFDMFDGQVARIARVTSDFGAQLDSLCDVVSFGVAPGILLVKMCPQFTQVHREAIWFIAALFACCAAMRLARFNVETDEDDDHSMFEGLPSPAAAAVIAGFAMLSYTLRNEMNYANFQGFDRWLQRILPLAAIAIALFMVSRIPYPHLVNHLVRGQKTFPQLVGIVVAALALLTVRWYAIPAACSLYALTPPIAHGWRWLWEHRHAMLRRAG